MYDLLKKAYANCPLILKQAYSKLPFPIRMGRNYRATYRLLEKSQRWSEYQLLNYQNEQLRKLIRYSYENVPYYRESFNRLGITPNDIKVTSDLQKLVFLTKELCRENFEHLISKRFSRFGMFYNTTGGTSGRPFGFYVSNEAYQKEWAFMITQWNRVGYKPSDRKITLRGVPFEDRKKLWQYNPIYNEIQLSPFHMSDKNLSEYVNVIREFAPRYIHGYPSAGAILAKYILKRDIQNLPIINAFLAASESVYQGQRELIEKAFHTRFFSWYGQSEKVILAGECSHSHHYHIFPEYGITELVDENGEVITEAGKIGELVGTGFLNYAMPFIRYKTGDYAEYVDAECKCGRQYKLIKNVSGRWIQEMLVGKDGALISLTAINMHSKVFDNVERFQFVQDKQGEAVLKIVKGNGYTEKDSIGILKELKNKVGNNLDIELSYVDGIPKSPSGKSIFLVQKLDVEL